jgi:hypothetical protein
VQVQSILRFFRDCARKKWPPWAVETHISDLNYKTEPSDVRPHQY